MMSIKPTTPRNFPPIMLRLKRHPLKTFIFDVFSDFFQKKPTKYLESTLSSEKSRLLE